MLCFYINEEWHEISTALSAVVNLFGAVTAEKILNSGEEKKETHPKGIPSTSGNSGIPFQKMKFRFNSGIQERRDYKLLQ